MAFELSPTQMGLLSLGANLLQAGGPSTTPTSLGQALGSGLMGGLQTFSAAQKAQQDAEESKLRSGLLRAQVENQSGELALKQRQNALREAMLQRFGLMGGLQGEPQQGPLENEQLQMSIDPSNPANAPLLQPPVNPAQLQAPRIDPNSAFALSLIDKQLGDAAFKQIDAESKLRGEKRSNVESIASLIGKGFQPVVNQDGIPVGLQGPNGQQLNPYQIDRAGEIFKDYGTDPTTKRTSDIVDSYARLSGLVQNGITGIDDIGFIFSIMKVFDPGSRVTSGEFDTTQRAKPFVGKIESIWRNITEGGTLDDKTRAELLQAARDQVGQQLRSQSRVDQRYSKRASLVGVDGENIIDPFDQTYNEMNAIINPMIDELTKTKQTKSAGGSPWLNFQR